MVTPLEPPHTNISCIFTVKILYKKRHVSIHFAQNMKLNSSMKHCNQWHILLEASTSLKLYTKGCCTGGSRGGEHMYIYIYCIPMNPLSSRTQWLGLRGSTQVSSMPQPRGQLPQHPSPRCDKEEDFCRPPRGHDTTRLWRGPR